MHAPPRLLQRRLRREAANQVVELALAELDGELAVAQRLGQPEGALVEPLVEDAQPVAVVEKRFHRGTVLTEEDEDGAAAYVAAETPGDEAAQPVKAPAQVDGLEPDEDFDATRHHRSLLSTSSTTASASREAPRR